MHVFQLFFTVQRFIGEMKWSGCLQEVGKVWRGPKGPLAPFYRFPPRSDLEKSLALSSTGGYRGSTGNSTGTSRKWFLED